MTSMQKWVAILNRWLEAVLETTWMPTCMIMCSFYSECTTDDVLCSQ